MLCNVANYLKDNKQNSPPLAQKYTRLFTLQGRDYSCLRGTLWKFKSWLQTRIQYSCYFSSETSLSIRYLLGASFGRQSKIILWYDFSISQQLKVRKVLSLAEIYLLSEPLSLSKKTMGSFVDRSWIVTWTLNNSSIIRLTSLKLLVR